jgi:hypothetical protein
VRSIERFAVGVSVGNHGELAGTWLCRDKTGEVAHDLMPCPGTHFDFFVSVGEKVVLAVKNDSFVLAVVVDEAVLSVGERHGQHHRLARCGCPSQDASGSFVWLEWLTYVQTQPTHIAQMRQP